MSFVGPRPERPYFVEQLARGDSVLPRAARRQARADRLGAGQVPVRRVDRGRDREAALRPLLRQAPVARLRPHDCLRHGEGHPLRKGRPVTPPPARPERPRLWGDDARHGDGGRAQRLHALPRLPRRRHPRPRHAAVQPRASRDGGLRAVDADDVVHRVFRDARPRLRRCARALRRAVPGAARCARAQRGAQHPLGRVHRDRRRDVRDRPRRRVQPATCSPHSRPSRRRRAARCSSSSAPTSPCVSCSASTAA